MPPTSRPGPLVTLAAAALVGVGLLTADLLTDPARIRADAAPAAAAAPVASTTPAAPPPTSTPASSSATSSATSSASATTRAVAAAYLAAAVYVGRDADRRTSVAVAVRDGRLAAYVCDGKALESWLTGTASGATASLTGGGDQLTAEATAGGLRVTGTVRGRPVDVTAALASAPAGLYRLEAGNTTAGWIVQPDGTQVGLKVGGGVVAPAPVLVPGQAVTVDGRTATAQEVSGDDRF
jgi:hypothetical protein